MQHLGRVAEVECPALISGETGTGKEIVAGMIHSSGPRRSGAFIPVNCAALTPTLAESQLFGHERGAFTGAVGSSLGVFRAAEGGVVFLDEVGEMPKELQPKLLRVLQQSEVTPVGASNPVPINVQVLAATNRDLEREVAAGRFRKDLLYRLNMVDLRLPPLRERIEDLPDLIDHFSRRFAAKYARPAWTPAPPTLQQFCEYLWPGNIRELQHVIEQGYVLDCEPHLPDDAQRRGCGRNIALRQSGNAPRIRLAPGAAHVAGPQRPRSPLAGRACQHPHPHAGRTVPIRCGQRRRRFGQSARTPELVAGCFALRSLSRQPTILCYASRAPGPDSRRRYRPQDGPVVGRIDLKLPYSELPKTEDIRFRKRLVILRAEVVKHVHRRHDGNPQPYGLLHVLGGHVAPVHEQESTVRRVVATFDRFA